MEGKEGAGACPGQCPAWKNDVGKYATKRVNSKKSTGSKVSEEGGEQQAVVKGRKIVEAKAGHKTSTEPGSPWSFVRGLVRKGQAQGERNSGCR